MKPTLYTALAVIIAAIAGPANATEFLWLDPNGGDFEDQANWFPGSQSTDWPMDGDDVATFVSHNTTYTVDFDSSITNDRFEVRVGNPIFDLHDDNTPFDDVYTYTLDTTTSAAAIISSNPGALFAPSLTLSGGGAGFLGALPTVETSQVLQIAVGATDTAGTLILNGTTHWSSTAAAFVGLNGNGKLIVGANSFMTSSNGVLGSATGSQGTADVFGLWDNTATDLVVGKAGTGTLNIDFDGNVRVLAGSLSIAEESGSDGEVNISGSGRLHTDGSLYVGGGPGGPGGMGELNLGGINTGPPRINVGDDLVIFPNGAVNLFTNEAYVENDIFLSPGAFLILNGGGLVTESLNGAANTMAWNSGRLFVQNGVAIDANAPLGASEFLGANKPLETDLLQVGPTAEGTLNITNVEVTGSVTEVGSLTPGTDPATLTVSGGTAALHAAAFEIRGASQATMNVQNGALVDHISSSRIAGPSGTNADVNIMNTGTLWDGDAPLYIGGDATTAGGTATVDVTDGAHMDIDDLLKLWPGATMLVDNATLTTDTLDVAGSLTIQNSSTFTNTTSINVTGDLSIQAFPFNLPELTITDTGHTTFPTLFLTVDTQGSGIDRLNLEGGTLTAPRIEFLSSFFGFGTLDASVITFHDNIFPGGDLTMGNPNVANAVRMPEDIIFSVGANHVTLLQKGFWDMPSFVFINGGTLSVSSGVAMRPGLFLSATGIVDARMSIAHGATIEADGGDLTLGDAASVAGFFSDGELYTGANTVTIHDANEAVLGSLTIIGDQSTPVSPGTLTATNGFLLEQGKNVTGYGVINGDFINQGYVEGVGPDAGDAIEFTGAVSGIGSYGGNTTFSGGFSPGNSPVISVFGGNAVYTSTSFYDAELEGTTPGAEHDQLDVAGTISIDGTLNVILLNGYTPDYLDEYVIITAGTRSGEYAQMNGLFINDDMTLAPVYDHDGNTGLTLFATIPGDADLDGKVDGFDLLKWQSNLFTGDQWTQGDFNLDGTVNGFDLLIWQSHLFNSVPSMGSAPAAAAVSVPEPGAGLLLVSGGVLLAGVGRSLRA